MPEEDDVVVERLRAAGAVILGLTNAVIGRKAVVNKMWRFMRGYDLLLTPTLACPPFGLYMQGPEIIEGRLVPPFAWLPSPSP